MKHQLMWWERDGVRFEACVVPGTRPVDVLPRDGVRHGLTTRYGPA